MRLKLKTDTAPAVGVLVDRYYEDADSGDVTAVEDHAIADVARDYPEHLTRITYSGKEGQVVRIRVFKPTGDYDEAVA